MKRPLYTIAHEEFATLLDRTHKAFNEAGIELALVGGVAVQTHVAHALTRQHSAPLLTLFHQERIRLQDHLRATDDVDIALRIPVDPFIQEPRDKDMREAQKILGAVDAIKGEGVHFSPGGEHLAYINLIRRGHSRPQFLLGLDAEGTRDKIASFNLYRGPAELDNADLKAFEAKTYGGAMDRAVVIPLSYAPGVTLPLRVKSAPDLLAVKIARGRPKDIGDALSLAHHLAAAGTPVDYLAVEDLFSLHGKDYGSRSSVLEQRYGGFRKLVETVGNGNGH